jgi:hypothetical protein
MSRKPEGLAPAFSCRLYLEQDAALRKQAEKMGLPLVTVLRMVLKAKTFNRTFEQCLTSLVQGTHGITSDTKEAVGG